MNMKLLSVWCVVGCLTLLSACSSVDKPKPTTLGANPELLGVRKAWSSSIGEVSFPLAVVGVGSEVAVASSGGTLAVLDARTGQDVWRRNLGEALSAGVGFDGKRVAAVTKANALVVLSAGKEQWRYVLGASTVTPPLVAGGRVFVLGSDRTVHAFDGASGRILWQQQRSPDALVLRQPGLLTALGDTLVVGVGGRMMGMNPTNGSVRWELPIASSRGSNEVEKLIEISSGVTRDGQQLCVRAYQHSLACVDTIKPVLQWSKTSAGVSGLAGDSDTVFGVDAQGVVSAFRRLTGDNLWSNHSLRYRQLTAPAVVGRSVVIGDAEGNVHLLSKQDGALLTRLSTDGSAVAIVPTLVAQTLVVVTQRGGVMGFKPE